MLVLEAYVPQEKQFSLIQLDREYKDSASARDACVFRCTSTVSSRPCTQDVAKGNEPFRFLSLHDL